MGNFLGKTSQPSSNDLKKLKAKRLSQQTHHHRLKPGVYLGLVLCLASSVYALNYSGIKLSQLTNSDNTQETKTISLASVSNSNSTPKTPATIRTLGATSTCSTVITSIYTKETDKDASNNQPMFPVFPSELFKDGSCSPAYWNLDVVVYLAYRVLKLLNIVAFILAILFTVTAGLYYIGGFANESNVKKAKTILIATYIGLAIVLSARIIVFGSFSYLVNKSVGTDVGGSDNNPGILKDEK